MTSLQDSNVWENNCAHMLKLFLTKLNSNCLAVLLSFVLWHLARTMDIQVGSLEKEEEYKFVKQTL